MALFCWVGIFVSFKLACDDCALFAICVGCGVSPKVLPECLNHIRDGGTDSTGEKGFLACFVVQVVADAVGKACKDELFLWARECVEECVSDVA